MNQQSIEITQYTQAPKFDSLTAIAVARRILVKSHVGASSRVARALADIRSNTEALQSVLRVRDRERPESLVPLETDFDCAWRGLNLRLQGTTQLRGNAKSTMAQRVVARLFRDGMTFISWQNDKKWLESEKFLARIDEEGLANEINELAGAEYLGLVRSTHSAFGDALGILHAAPQRLPRRAPVQENLTALSVAIGAYMRAHLGETDVTDPESIARFLEWMQPIDAARVARTNRNEGGEDESGTEESEDPAISNTLVGEPAPDVGTPSGVPANGASRAA